MPAAESFVEILIKHLTDIITSRLTAERINSLITRNAKFTTNKIEVEMSSGPDYPAIRLTATEFQVLHNEFLLLDYVIPIKDTNNQRQSFTQSYAPPLGLYETGPEELRAKCSDHIKRIISQKRDTGEVNCGDVSIITLQAFEAINTYRRSSPEGAHVSRSLKLFQMHFLTDSVKSPLLRKAVMLYAMNYFMNRILTFTKESAGKAVNRLLRPQSLPFEEALQVSRVLTSTLLNLQIKQAMQNLLRDTTRTVLRGLETEILIIPKSPDTWADNFCIVLILCMCIEAVQVESDSRAMTALRKDPTCTLSRTDICQKLDYVPFGQLTNLFHTAYRTKRAKSNHENKIGINPIRYGFPIKEGEGITPQMRTLVNEMKIIMTSRGRGL